jgi:hypothetical protein
MLRPILTVVMVTVLTACAGTSPCPPGDDCRWLLDGERLGFWAGAEPTAAAVLRLELPTLAAVHAYVVWDRCGEERCPWQPPTSAQSLRARYDAGAWVVSLPRPAFERDLGSEVVVPVADGSRARFGVARPSSIPSDRRGGIDACRRDLTAALGTGPGSGAPAVAPVEIELACRIWLHEGQGRDAMQWHPRLHAVAREHACDMATRAYFGHTDPDGIGPNRRVREAGYVLPWWYEAADDANNVESLALRGPTSTPATTLEQWLASAPHRGHVLAEHPTVAQQHDVAVGYCRGHHDGVDHHYWVFVSAETGSRPFHDGPEGDRHGEHHRLPDPLQSQR